MSSAGTRIERALLHVPRPEGRWRRNLAGLAAVQLARWRLRRSGFAATARWVESISAASQDTVDEPDAMRLAATVARWAGRTRATCLPRSLAMAALLRRNGVGRVQLRIGVDPDQPEGEKHAWIEVGGEPWLESPDLMSRLIPFPADRPLLAPDL